MKVVQIELGLILLFMLYPGIRRPLGRILLVVVPGVTLAFFIESIATAQELFEVGDILYASGEAPTTVKVFQPLGSRPFSFPSYLPLKLLFQATTSLPAAQGILICPLQSA